MSFGTPVGTWRKIGITLFTSLALLGGTSLSAKAAMLYHMVDAQNGTGNMVLNLINSATSYDNVNNQWNFTLQATNTGATTYNDVNLMLQFVWDQATNPQSALSYTNSNSWGGVVNSTTDHITFSGYGINPNPATTPLVAFPWTIANTPLTWSSGSQNTASISPTDTLPTVPLGNFGPGATETFKLAAPSNNFLPDIVGLYVAVPEPSTIMLLAFSGVGMLGYAWRRRAMRR
jgi:hypothetical protein